MPTIYPPKLRDIYANTFFIPSSITNNFVTSNYVLASDGNGTTRWVAQSGGGGPATIPAELTVSTLYAFDTISTSSTFTGYISAGIGLFTYLSTQDLRVSSINGLPPGSGSNTPNLNLSTLYVADTISSVSTFVDYISAGIGVFNFISVADFYVSSINNQAVLTPVDLISTVDGLGTAGYVSSFSLFSTTTGIEQQINSTVTGLGTAGYISSLSLNSTVIGLGTAGYVSSLSLNSTVVGLGTAGYVSSTQLFSTILGLPNVRFGSGQTDNTGIISLSFSPAFTTTPSIFTTPQGFAVLAVTNIATTGADVLSFNPTNGLAQGAVDFQWQAIGFM